MINHTRYVWVEKLTPPTSRAELMSTILSPSC